MTRRIGYASPARRLISIVSPSWRRYSAARPCGRPERDGKHQAAEPQCVRRTTDAIRREYVACQRRHELHHDEGQHHAPCEDRKDIQRDPCDPAPWAGPIRVSRLRSAAWKLLSLLLLVRR